MSQTINIGQLSAEVEKMLKEYSNDITMQTTEIAETVANEAQKKLKASSPVGRGKNAGRYAKGWSVQTEKSNLGTSFTVHNKTDYQLTHLLERGHAVVVGGRKLGKTTRPQVHIEPVEQWANEEFEKRITEAIQK